MENEGARRQLLLQDVPRSVRAAIQFAGSIAEDLRAIVYAVDGDDAQPIDDIWPITVVLENAIAPNRGSIEAGELQQLLDGANARVNAAAAGDALIGSDVWPHIFVSLGLFGEGETRALFQRLNAARLSVLWDQGLEDPDEATRRRIYAQVFRCNSAILVLSPDVLAARRTQYVATILAARCAVDPPFRVVTMLQDPVPDSVLNEWPLAHIRADVVHAAVDEAADAVAARVVDKIAAIKSGESPLRTLEIAVSGMLKAVQKTSETAIVESAEALALKLNCRPAEHLPTFLAKNLLNRNLVEVQVVITRLARYGVRPEIIKDLLDWLAYWWVDPGAAALIPIVLKRQNAPRSIWVNGCVAFTAQSYLRRAKCGLPDWPSTPVDTDATLAALETRELQVETLRTMILNDIALVKRLDMRGASSLLKIREKPHFVVLLGQPVDRDVLAAVQQEYGAVIFFILSRGECPKSNDINSDSVVFLRPALDATREDEAYRVFLEMV
jgi:hypothetical protein